jgi:hypothetical protein
MTLAATFLGGAQSRLLPASVPFRFFAVAAIAHVLMWIVLLASADEIAGFRGGLGPTLAAVHLLTLGVLTMTAIGASVQLLPVATRHALPAVWPIKLVFWLAVPGIALLISGMLVLQTTLLTIGAAATAAGLLLFGLLLADNLRRAPNLGPVGAYGWIALAAFVMLIGLGLLLAFDYHVGSLPDRGAVALAHLILGGYGFMGMLALGFSQILVPMFALAAGPRRGPSLLAALLAAGALSLGTLGALDRSRSMLGLAGLLGLAASGLHLTLMARVLRTGMRKRLGLSFVLIRAAWAMLPISLIVGVADLFGFAGRNGATLFGFLLLGGWLLTFLLGILQRIVPFLASMHAARSSDGAPLRPSELADAWPLRLHAICHAIALVCMAAAIVLNHGLIMRIACAIGGIGALAFAWFVIDVLRRLFPMRVQRSRL